MRSILVQLSTRAHTFACSHAVIGDRGARQHTRERERERERPISLTIIFNRYLELQVPFSEYNTIIYTGGKNTFHFFTVK
jgi:hypothetical protein